MDTNSAELSKRSATARANTAPSTNPKPWIDPDAISAVKPNPQPDDDEPERQSPRRPNAGRRSFERGLRIKTEAGMK